jgi:osmotically-inducible protein OsmY
MTGKRDTLETGRSWVERVEETLPGADLPPVHRDYPSPSDADAEIHDPRDLMHRVRRTIEQSDDVETPRSLTVGWEEGMLTLSGRIGSIAQGEAVEAVARQVSPRVNVVNKLTIVR